MLIKAPALGQQAEAVTHRSPCGRALQAVAGLAGEPLRLRRADALFDKAADIAEHGPRLHRGELILVAEQDQAGVARQCIEQPCHHRQIDHGGLIHHQQVEVQRVARVVAELAAPRNDPEQPVQGARFGGDRLHPLGGQIEGLQGRTDTLGEARRRLAGGGHQPDRWRLARLQAGLHQNGEQFGHSRGLAGAGAAGDHRKGARRRGGRRQLLTVAAERLGHQRIQLAQVARRLGAGEQRLDGGPIHFIGKHQIEILLDKVAGREVGGEAGLEQRREHQPVVAGKQPRQSRGYLRPFGTFTQSAQMAGHPLLMIVVASEVEPPAPQPQQPARGRPLILFGTNQGTLCKQGGPAGRIRQIPQQIPALLGIQPERAQGSGSQHFKRQTDMAAPQLEAGERRPQHQLGAAAKVGHQPGKLQIQLADAASQRQCFEPFNHHCAGCGAGCGADHGADHVSTSFNG